MKELGFLMVVIILSGSVATRSHAALSENSDQGAILRLEDEQAKADRTGDISFYETNLTDDYTAGTSWGSWYSKESFLKDLRDTVNNHTNHTVVHDMKVRVYSDAAIATYGQTYDATVQGRRVQRRVINTDVFVRRNGRWMMAAQHTSAVK